MPAVSGFSELLGSAQSHPCKLTSHMLARWWWTDYTAEKASFTCLPACLHACVAEQTWAPRSDQSFLPIDRSHRNRSRFMCSTCYSLVLSSLYTGRQSTSSESISIRNNRRMRPWNWWESTKPFGLSQGCRGSRLWGSLLMLLTCCPVFSGFLVDLIGVQRKSRMHK